MQIYSIHPTIPKLIIENKKKVGCFKEELNSKPVFEFVGLRAKIYSLFLQRVKRKQPRGSLEVSPRKKIKHENYKEALFQSKLSREIQYRIQFERHQIYTIRQNKVALTPINDKRYVLDYGEHTLAYVHHQITYLFLLLFLLLMRCALFTHRVVVERKKF